MAELLDLSSQRASASTAPMSIDYNCQTMPRDQHQPPPLNCRIAMYILPIKQVPVLDEQQRVHDQRRDVIEIPIDSNRIACAVKDCTGPVIEGQPRLVLFLIRCIEAMVHDPSETG